MSAARRLTLSLVAYLCVFTWGCETVTMTRRADIDRRDNHHSDMERNPDVRSRELAHDDIIGTVQRVDEARREIQLRTTEARMVVIKYDPNTVVYSRDRELRVDYLRHGDLILVQVAKDTSGEPHADLIRVNDRPEMGSRH